MDRVFSRLDWSLVRSFLAVAETGSLSAAARSLGSSQPTVGRHITSLESELEAELFHRKARGLELTALGLELIVPAKAMRDSMAQIAMRAGGERGRLEGTVRITASVMISTYHLPRIVSEIRTAEPEIAIELVPSDESRNLLFREADIAIRMYRPTQLDLVARHLGDIGFGAYATRSYLKAHGRPTTPKDLAAHDLIGFDQQTDLIDGLRAAGLEATRDLFKIRTDDQVLYWELLRSGLGIGFGQLAIGERDPDLERIDLGFPLPSLPVWLTAHESIRATPRIKRVWDLLADGLNPLFS